MQFVDKVLARRFEACEEMPQVLYARVFQKTRPEIGAAEEEICGGHMIFAGLGSPIGRATGLGLDREFTAQDLDHVEQFYRSHRAPAQVDLCPLHDPAVFEMFKERGYGIAELNNVLYRRLEPKENFPPAPEGCEIRRGRPEEAEELGGIVERAFFPDGAPEAFTGSAATALSNGRGSDVCGKRSRQNGGLRSGSGHPPASDFCPVRSWDDGGVSRTRIANSAAKRTAGGCGSGRVRVCSGGHTGRQCVPEKLRAAGISRGLQ